MLSELCVRRPVFATMLVMSLVVLGTFSFRGLGVDLFPKADPATVSVVLSLPGASPDEMSTSVVEPMEQAISGVSGIDEIQARIAEGRGQITVRFVLERDLNDASNDVREKVASAIRNMPPDAAAAGHHQGRSGRRSGHVAHRLVGRDEPAHADRADRQADCPRHPDGQRRRRSQPRRRPCARDPHRRRHREAQLVRPVDDRGARRRRRRERRDSRRHGRAGQGTAAAAHARPRRRIAGLQRHRRRDAETARRSAFRTSAMRKTRSSGRRALSGSARLRPSCSTSGAPWARTPSRSSKACAPSWRRSSARLPSAVKITVIRDDSRFIYASIASLEEHLIFGALFATIVVMVFIRNLRAVLISALAIPASIISSFTLMNIMGFTLNNMTLLGITLAVGIVIDDAIVVLENIFRYIEEKGCSPFEAAIEGTREVALAVMATTLSLVVIFLPIAFMSGYAKRFINPFGWTIAFAIMVSMLVSFTLTPMLSSRFLKLSDADSGSQDQGTRLLPLARRMVYAAGELGARSSDGHHRHLGRHRPADLPAQSHGRPRVRAQRRHGRVDRARRTRRKARRSRARARSRSSCSRNLKGIEGVAQIEPSVGVSGRPAARRPTSISSVRRCRSTSARTRRRRSSPRCAAGWRRTRATGRASARARRSAAAKAPADSRSRRTSSGRISTRSRSTRRGRSSRRRACPASPR